MPSIYARGFLGDWLTICKSHTLLSRHYPALNLFHSPAIIYSKTCGTIKPFTIFSQLPENLTDTPLLTRVKAEPNHLSIHYNTVATHTTHTCISPLGATCVASVVAQWSIRLKLEKKKKDLTFDLHCGHSESRKWESMWTATARLSWFNVPLRRRDTKLQLNC